MKNSSFPKIDSPTGRTYWRSLDQLAETPEFRQWMEREFPAGASELADGMNRRHFVRIMSASFLLAGLGAAGCRRPEHEILPFAKMPEDYVHGVSRYFATAMPKRGGAIPLVVRSYEGRPVKVSGNPEHPASNGGTSTHVQASLLDLYDPDRAQSFLQDGKEVNRGWALSQLDTLARRWGKSGGEGVAFLVEPSTSPSRRRVQRELMEKYPKVSWHVFDPLEWGNGAGSLRAEYSLEPAAVLLSLDADFLGSDDRMLDYTRDFARGRRLEDSEDSMNRLYAVEARMSLTGANADHRLRVPASRVTQIAAGVAAEVLAVHPGNLPERIKNSVLPVLRKLAGNLERDWVRECARDLRENPGRSVIMAGPGQPAATHAIAAIINAALGNIGNTIAYFPVDNEGDGLAALVRKLNSGQVSDLVILGGNPVYTAPADLELASALEKADSVVRLGYYPDETSARAEWLFPMAHYLESWGDARSSDGTLVPVQPLIRPLFDGLTEIEVLARLAGDNQAIPYEIVRATFRALTGDENFELRWQRFLHDGYLAGSAQREPAAELPWDDFLVSLQRHAPSDPPGLDRLEVIFHPDYALGDGSGNNNGWLQELPDPVTKLTWDNAVVISRKTARELQVQNGDVVSVRLENREVRGPVWIQPGMADFTLALALGYGRNTTGRVGMKTGFNVYPLRTRNAPYLASGAVALPAGSRVELACVQDHWTMAGRAIVREANRDQYREYPDFATRIGMQTHTPNEGPIYQHPYRQYQNHLQRGTATGPIIKSQIHQWGMSIDLNACTGCSACVVACQSENNIPIVGKEQVLNGREMQWMRIDRYFTANPELPEDNQVDNPQVAVQPMLCQHCETAPCENVCPVNATVHDEEGLNVMAYNRCVGTRYCSNNCPYKVRRFNFFDYNKRPLDKLYWGPMAKRSEERLDLVKLIKNPDVTVRMRGVMEKCTYCTQRIEAAKIAQKVKAGASGEVEVPDGTIRTACEEACPAEAIVFGNTLDSESRVSKLKQRNRDYDVLGYLDTRPRTTYLARVRNPNPRMPDYHENPFSLAEYAGSEGGNPFADHHAETGPDAENGAEAAQSEKGGH